MADDSALQPGEESPESSIRLLARSREGDADALNRLIARHLAPLQRWARGRLPYAVRDLEDTGDLVQETLIQALKHVDHFEYRREGALQAYLRHAVYNRIKMEYRRRQSHPAKAPLDTECEDPAASPLDQAVGREAVERYE